MNLSKLIRIVNFLLVVNVAQNGSFVSSSGITKDDGVAHSSETNKVKSTRKRKPSNQLEKEKIASNKNTRRFFNAFYLSV